jgi:hypothetical protein
MGPYEAFVAIAVMSALAVSVKAIASAVVRYQENRLRYRAQQSNAITDARLERIEHAVDAIAIEIERISEAQRFTTRLLNERAGAPSDR